MGKVTLRSDLHELGVSVDHACVVALTPRIDDAVVGAARFFGKDVLFARGLVAAQRAKGVERVAERAGGDENHPPVTLLDGGRDDPPDGGEVVGLRGLAGADGQPRFVALQERKEVRRGVLNR